MLSCLLVVLVGSVVSAHPMMVKEFCIDEKYLALHLLHFARPAVTRRAFFCGNFFNVGRGGKCEIIYGRFSLSSKKTFN